jgi:MYXO-CTERM domain-containing protein
VGGRGEGQGGGSVATGGHAGGTGGNSEGAIGGGAGHEADAGTPPPKPPSGGCNCSLGEDLPGPGAFLFSLLGGGLALRGRGRRAKSARAPQASGPC